MQGSTISYPHRDCMIKSILSQVISKCKHIFALLLTSCDKNYKILVLPFLRVQEGGVIMYIDYDFIVSVMASIVAYCICKWLDRN